MSTRTQNYNLIRPGADDQYDINDFNSNADAVDAAVKGVSDRVGALEQDPSEPGYVPNTPWIQLVRTTGLLIHYKGHDNVVYVQIRTTGTSDTPGDRIGVLPVGFRPQRVPQTGSFPFLDYLRFGTAINGSAPNGYEVRHNGDIIRHSGTPTCFAFSVIT